MQKILILSKNGPVGRIGFEKSPLSVTVTFHLCSRTAGGGSRWPTWPCRGGSGGWSQPARCSRVSWMLGGNFKKSRLRPKAKRNENMERPALTEQSSSTLNLSQFVWNSCNSSNWSNWWLIDGYSSCTNKSLRPPHQILSSLSPN